MPPVYYSTDILRMTTVSLTLKVVDNTLKISSFSFCFCKDTRSLFSQLLHSAKQWAELREKENFIVHIKNIQNAAIEKRDCKNLYKNRMK